MSTITKRTISLVDPIENKIVAAKLCENELTLQFERRELPRGLVRTFLDLGFAVKDTGRYDRPGRRLQIAIEANRKRHRHINWSKLASYKNHTRK